MEGVSGTGPNYAIECFLGEAEVSMKLEEVTILNSINSPYQTIIIKMKSDAKEMITSDSFGSEGIKLKFIEMDENEAPGDMVDVELVVIKLDLSTPKADQFGGEEGVADPLTIIGIPKEPFLAMTKTINKLVDDTKRLTPVEIVESIVAESLPGLNANIIKDNENPEKIFQFMIPPMTFMDVIRYIDGTDPETVSKYGSGLGMFNGPMFFQCRWEEDMFCLWDLSTIIKEPPQYTVYHMAAGADDKEIMKEVAEAAGDDKFYTHSDLDSKFSGSQDVASSAYKTKFLTKPLDSFSNWVEVDTEDVLKSGGVGDGTREVALPEEVKGRIEYKTTGEVGNGYSDVVYKSKMAKKFSQGFKISFTVDRRIKITKLARVGIPMELKPQVMEYEAIQGKFIVSSSHIVFSKPGGQSWMCAAKIEAFRGNVKY